jgi:hypothetical protein
MSEPNVEACLRATPFIDAGHPSITGLVDGLGVRELPPVDRARMLFEYVKREVRYEFSAKLVADEYVASNVLAQGRGFCVQKAVLLAALGRAAGIPTALVLSDMRDHTLPRWVAEALTTDVMHHHGLDAFYLDGQWWKVDASLSPDVTERKGYRDVAFAGNGDALLPETTLAGAPHAEYLTFHGAYDDLPFAQMLEAFGRAYANADVQKLSRFRL